MMKFVSVCFILSWVAFCWGTAGAEQALLDGSDERGHRVHVTAAPELCAELDAELNLKINCAQYMDQPYDFALRHFINVADPANLYWYLDAESIVSADCDCQSECATIDDRTLNISFPCFRYNEIQYDSPITLQRSARFLEPAAILWRLILPPQIATLTLFPITGTDCPGTGTVSSMGVKKPGEVVVGVAETPPATRGYIEFEEYGNMFSQDQTLKVDKAFLRIFVTDPSGEDCDIRVGSLQDIVNREAASLQHLCSLRVGGGVIWDEIASGPALSQGTTGTNQSGWFELPLDPSAVEAMLRRTDQSFIGIGIMEVGDDGDALAFEGWNSHPLYLPQLVIDYYVEEGASNRPDETNPPPK